MANPVGPNSGFDQSVRQMGDLNKTAQANYDKHMKKATHVSVLGVDIPKLMFSDDKRIEQIKHAQTVVWPQILQILADANKESGD